MWWSQKDPTNCFQSTFVASQRLKVIRPKYYEHLKKPGWHSHLGRKKMGWFLADQLVHQEKTKILNNIVIYIVEVSFYSTQDEYLRQRAEVVELRMTKGILLVEAAVVASCLSCVYSSGTVGTMGQSFG